MRSQAEREGASVVEANRRVDWDRRMRMYRGVAKLLGRYDLDDVLCAAERAWKSTLGKGMAGADVQHLLAEQKAVAIAISDGMTLREYHECDSARSWLARPREGGAA